MHLWEIAIQNSQQNHWSCSCCSFSRLAYSALTFQVVTQQPLSLLTLDLHLIYCIFKFLSGFNALYHSPQTRIRIPGYISDFFPLSRGTRQCCPLSPLLFALAIEPMAQKIWNSIDIKGYLKGDNEFKCSVVCKRPHIRQIIFPCFHISPPFSKHGLTIISLSWVGFVL